MILTRIALVLGAGSASSAEETGDQSPLWSTRSPQSAAWQHEFHLYGRITDPRRWTGRALLLDDDRDDTLALRGKIDQENVAQLEFDVGLRDFARISGTESEGLLRADQEQWQANQVADLTLRAGFLDDRLRFATRAGWSRYESSGSYLRRAAEDEKRERGRAERFAGGKGDGTAMLGRWEGDLARDEDLRVTLFGEGSSVQSTYEDLRHSGKGAKKEYKDDPFAEPNRQTLKAGVDITWGSINASLGQRWTSNVSGDAQHYRRGRAVEVGGAVNLHGLDWLMDGAPASISAIIPSSVWAKWSGGPVDRDPASATPTDSQRDWSTGLSWDFDQAYASVSGWWSRFDSRRPQVEDADWLGAGADLSFGFYREHAGGDIYVSLSRSDDLDPDGPSSDLNIGGGASFWLAPDDLPVLSGSLDIGSYLGRYPAWDGREAGASMTAGVAIDLSDYVDRDARGLKTLRLVYAFSRDAYTSRWGDAQAAGVAVDNFFGLIIRASF